MILDKAEDIFVAANRWALILILAAMSLVVFANVVLRYLTNFSLVWAEELARYLMIWMTFLGAGLVLRFGGHVAIDSLHHVLSEGVARAVRIVLAILMVAFFAAMAWQGIRYMQLAQFQTTPAMHLSFSTVYAAIPVGFALLIIHLLLIIRLYVRHHRFVDSDEVNADTAAV